MKKIVLAISGAGSVLTVATVMPAAALTSDPGTMRAAIEAVNPVAKAWYRHYYGYRPYYRGYGSY